MKKIAVLITSFNRKNITLNCLKFLFKSIVNKKFKFKVYLVDDNSVDNTFQEVKIKYPVVKLIKGDGNLHWTGGTNLALQYALKDSINYDYYLLLNDDTFVKKDCISKL